MKFDGGKSLALEGISQMKRIPLKPPGKVRVTSEVAQRGHCRRIIPI